MYAPILPKWHGHCNVMSRCTSPIAINWGLYKHTQIQATASIKVLEISWKYLAVIFLHNILFNSTLIVNIYICWDAIADRWISSVKFWLWLVIGGRRLQLYRSKRIGSPAQIQEVMSSRDIYYQWNTFCLFFQNDSIRKKTHAKRPISKILRWNVI